MKFNFIRKGNEKWRFSHDFLVGLLNFTVGFIVAWVMWSTTANYIFALIQ